MDVNTFMGMFATLGYCWGLLGYVLLSVSLAPAKKHLKRSNANGRKPWKTQEFSDLFAPQNAQNVNASEPGDCQGIVKAGLGVGKLRSFLLIIGSWAARSCYCHVRRVASPWDRLGLSFLKPPSRKTQAIIHTYLWSLVEFPLFAPLRGHQISRFSYKLLEHSQSIP